MITVEYMKRGDVDAVYAIECECFSIPWEKASFYEELNNRLAIYFTAKENGVIAGYAGMWHVVNEGHITNVAVAPPYRRRGIADKLMREFFEVAHEKEMIGLTLEVRMGNAAAMGLYAKYGFKAEGIRKNYYADTKEDAVVMWKYF